MLTKKQNPHPPKHKPLKACTQTNASQTMAPTSINTLSSSQTTHTPCSSLRLAPPAQPLQTIRLRSRGQAPVSLPSGQCDYRGNRFGGSVGVYRSFGFCWAVPHSVALTWKKLRALKPGVKSPGQAGKSGVRTDHVRTETLQLLDKVRVATVDVVDVVHLRGAIGNQSREHQAGSRTDVG